MGFMALVIAFASVAFTDHKPAKDPTPRWYYTLPTAEGENTASNYTALNGQDAFCITVGTVRCVIEAPDNGSGQPNLSQMTVISRKQ